DDEGLDVAPSHAAHAGAGGSAGAHSGGSAGSVASPVAGNSSSLTAGSAGQGGSGGQGIAGASGGAAQGGSGGAAAAGTAGSAGSTGSAGSNGGGSLDGISVQYKVLSAQASNGAIQCQIDIVDSGSLSVPLSEFTLRYYYTSEVNVETTIDLNWAGVNPGSTDLGTSLTKQVVDMPAAATGADTYVELGFSGAAPTLTPDHMAEISWQVRAKDWSQNYVQTGDYSFDSSKTELSDWDHVVLLRNGEVVWGAEP
ncbi:MAG TPA: cellulose binding domain-containing protein, partial [Polyangiaceae bacterium]|nr:cellulose binding domain-containing protein [Polyangiaceae bacterium]